MPWSETSTMDQKRLFIQDYMRGSFTMAELCRRYGISRPTGYKWVAAVRGRRISGLGGAVKTATRVLSGDRPRSH